MKNNLTENNKLYAIPCEHHNKDYRVNYKLGDYNTAERAKDTRRHTHS